MSKNSTLEIISINKIELSNTNPRKSIDSKALEELSQSIKEHGILQPILVRPINSSLVEPWEQFELVCGERRYRAAKLAGLEEIPVNIRVLTDDEAFELQIIENLERKDVHPLDEADAFKKMLDSGKYTIEDIAAKMAKSESFIVQRLKLVDLVEVLRDDFLAGYFGIGHAILLARCDEFKQFDAYEEAQMQNSDPDYGTVKELRESIEGDSYLLTDAKFDLSDTKLNNTCACDVCPKRSGANPVLFEDMQEDRCFDEKCFDAKNEAFIEKEVAKIINEGKNIKILAGYSTVSDIISTMCKEYGIKLLSNYNDYYSNEIQEATKAKGFLVSGRYAGTYIDIWIKNNEEETTSHEATTPGLKTPMSKEEIEAKEEIAKIESRADRAKELDGEKVWTAIRAIDTSEIKTIIGGLFEVEINAVCLAMISKLGYYGNQEVKKLVGDFNLKTLQQRDFTKFEYNQIQRIFFLECLPVAFGDYYSNLNNYAYTKALIHYKEKEIQELIDNQKVISDARMDKADAKIKELKSKIEKLKVTTVAKTKEVVAEEEIGQDISAITSTLDTPAKRIKDKAKKIN